MKKIRLMLVFISILVLSNISYANDTTKILVIGKSLNGEVYQSNLGDGSFWLPLEETARILGADVYKDENKMSIILMNFPGVAQTYKTPYSLGSTQYNFVAGSSEIGYITDSYNAVSNYYMPEHSVSMIDGTMYLLSTDIAKMFNLSIYYNPDINVYYVGSYAVPASGKYSGFQILKGYPLENLYNLYFKIDGNSSYCEIENLAPKNMNEIITFNYQGKTYTTTRLNAYKYFDDINSINSSLSKLGLDDITKDINTNSEKMFGSVSDDWLEEWGNSVNLEKYFRKYSTWLERQERQKTEKLRSYTSEEDLYKQKQERERAKKQEEMKKDLEKYVFKMEAEWYSVPGYEMEEWQSKSDISKRYGLSIYPSTEKRYYWDLFKDYRMVGEIPFPSKDYYLNDDKTIKTVNGIRIKYHKFNVYDLEEKGYIEIDKSEIKPSQVDYVNGKIKEYMSIKYPNEDPTQFYIKESY